MKETALYQEHIALGAKMTPFAGYQMPLEYSGVIKEHMAVREAAGIFDVSHMGEFWVKGNGALGLLEKLCSNSIASLKIGQALYTVMPNGKGGIVDDLIVYYYEKQKYLVVVNASNIEKDWQWIYDHNTFGAELENASEQMSLIALQGPLAKSILQKITECELDDVAGFHFITTKIAGSENVIISNTGYTGAGGFEIYCYNNDAKAIWKELIKVGANVGLVPAGLAARDTLRLEMGYCLYGNDIDETTSPIEAGLGWVVKFKENKDFIDKDFLQEQKLNGTKRKLIGFEMQERGIPRHNYTIVDEDDNVIGKVTSGTMSPVLQKGIGMAYIKSELASDGNTIYLQIRSKKLKAIIRKFPFI
jgi:aminomethyltransferase